MKQVFIIPEPHMWDKSFKNRKDYPQEIQGYLRQIMTAMQQVEPSQCYAIFDGDIFHRGYTSVNGMTETLSLLVELNRLTDNKVYSVIGNHELSYPQNNPFWMMAQDHSSRFTKFNQLPAYGVFNPGIRIVDYLYVGSLNFIFGHYGRRDYAKIQDTAHDLVLISHNSIIAEEIHKIIVDKYKRGAELNFVNATQLYSQEAIPLTECLKYVFVGHMHTMYSDFLVEDIVGDKHMKFYLRYLGSLGRTSITEVRNDDLVRTIPRFIIKDDDSYTYEPLTLTLQPYESVIEQQVVEENKAKREAHRAMEYLSSSAALGESPEMCIRHGLAEYPEYLELFEELFYNRANTEISSLLEEAGTL